MATYVAKTNSELYEFVQEQCYKAMQDSVDECYEELQKIILEDVYRNRPKNPKFRTKWLLARYKEIFTVRAYKHFGKGVGLWVNPKLDMAVPSDPKHFRHGAVLDKEEGIYSNIQDMTSYLEMLNNPDFINHPNRFYFPRVIEDRKPFWDDYVKWFDKNFPSIYEKNLSKYVELRHMPYKGDRYVLRT